MPMNPANYPPNWKQISKSVREAVGNCCEQCGVKNHIYIVRSDVDPARWIEFNPDEGSYSFPDGVTVRLSEVPEEYSGREIWVVLTVAHLNHNTQDNRLENLKALCQRCHLQHDRQHHQLSRKRTRLRKKAEALQEQGQLPLGGLEHG
jgi:tRNA(Ile)-lysidine synthase TilS/MesJ